MILIAFSSYSQSTIQITPEQAKEAIKAKQRVIVLESAITAQGMAIMEFKEQVKDLAAQVRDNALQSSLWEKNYNLMKTRYEAEKAKKPKFTLWKKISIGAAAFLAGLLAGVMN